MQKNKWTKTRLLVLAVLPAMVTAGVAAASLYLPSLPSPAGCNRDQLIRWVVTRDLSAESAESRAALALRLDQEFRGGVDWSQLGNRMGDSQRQQLWQNLPLLLEAWLREKASVYARLSTSERTKLLDYILDTLATWQGADSIRPASKDDHGAAGAETLLALFQRRMREYVHRAPSPEREQMSQLLLSIQMRGLAKRLRN